MNDDTYRCPVCGATGSQWCTTVSGRDHKARAFGWPTARQPKNWASDLAARNRA